MTTDQTEMLIRHDEQLKALAPLPSKVDELAERQNSLSTDLKVFVGKAAAVIGCATMLGTVIGCLGTWFILWHTATPAK